MFHQMMQQGEVPVGDLMRMLQIQNRPNDKDGENGGPTNGNKDLKVNINIKL